MPKRYKGVELVDGAKFVSQLGAKYRLTKRENDGKWAALNEEDLRTWAGDWKRNPVDAVWMLVPFDEAEERFQKWLKDEGHEERSSTMKQMLREAFMAGRASVEGKR